MIIYIEIVLFVNIVIHLLTLFLIKETNYLRVSKLFYLTIPFDLLYMILYINGYDVTFFKYFMPLLYVFLSFKTNLYTYIKIYIIYLIFNYLLGGITTTINISGNLGYFILFIIGLTLSLVLYCIFKKKDIYKTYKIRFFFKENEYKIEAFFDTGCDLFYKGYPVIILNRKFHFKIKTFDKITFTSGSGNNIEDIYLLNNVFIENKKIKCYCIFLDIEYDAIIGNNIISN